MEARKDMRKSPLPKPGSILGALLGARGGLEITKSQKPQKCKYGGKVGFNGEIDDFCEIK